MADQKGYVSCGCDPLPTPRGGGCTSCSPNQNEVLTSEEESILARMRGIKEEVRPIAHKLRIFMRSWHERRSGLNFTASWSL